MTDMKIVTFKKAWRGYAAGETAGFDPAAADALIEAGRAKLYVEKTTTTEKVVTPPAGKNPRGKKNAGQKPAEQPPEEKPEEEPPEQAPPEQQEQQEEEETEETEEKP